MNQDKIFILKYIFLSKTRFKIVVSDECLYFCR